jgi:hypothetical protein
MVSTSGAGYNKCQTALVDWVAGLDGSGEGFEDEFSRFEAFTSGGEEIFACRKNAVIRNKVL